MLACLFHQDKGSILIDLPSGWQVDEVHDSQLIASLPEENETVASVTENVPQSVEESKQLEEEIDTLLKEMELLLASEEVSILLCN